MKIQTSKKAGFTLVEIMIVVAIISLLAAIAIPNFVKARETARKNTCINNLRLIDGAKQTAALEFNLSTGATPTSAQVAPYLGRGNSTGVATLAAAGVTCPSSGTYTMGTVSVAPTCSKSAQGHALPNPAGAGSAS